MSTSNQYLDRLKTIRDKYTLTKTTPQHLPDFLYDRNYLKNYLQSELYTLDKTKYLDAIPAPTSITNSKTINYSSNTLTTLTNNLSYGSAINYYQNLPHDK
jgi:hypothetical protein